MIHTSSFSYRCHSKKSQVQTNIFLIFIRTCCYYILYTIYIQEDINFFSIIKKQQQQQRLQRQQEQNTHTKDKLKVRKHTCSLTEKFKLSLYFISGIVSVVSIPPATTQTAKMKTTKWRFRWKSIHV